MGNEEDWKKLQQWREQKEAEQQIDLERRRRPSKGLKETEEKPDNMMRAAKAVHNLEDVRDVLIQYKDEVKLIFYVILAIIAVVYMYLKFVPDEPDKVIEEEFGQTFEEIGVQEYPDQVSVHTYTSTQYPGINVHVRIERGKIVGDDIAYSLYKYYFEKLDPAVQAKFKIEEKENNEMLTKYKVTYIFDGMNDIDEAIQTVYETRQTLKKDIEDQWWISIESKSKIWIRLNLNAPLKENLEEGKRIYVGELQKRIKEKKVKKEELTEEEKSVTKEMLEQYYRPTVQVLVDGEPLKDREDSYAEAECDRGSYVFFLRTPLLEKLPGVSILDENEIHYRNFAVNGQIYENRGMFYEKDFQEKFGITLEFDYINETVNIVTKPKK